jgi:hypothetical protein
MTEASTDMRSIVQKRANEIIANKLKADQGIIGENIESVAFESRQGVGYGGEQPATGTLKDELGIHREDLEVV